MNPKSARAGIIPHAARVSNPHTHNPLPPDDPILPDEVLPLRLKTVALITDFSEKTVRRWIQSGSLRAHKLGGACVIRKSDLRSFLDQQAGQTKKEVA